MADNDEILVLLADDDQDDCLLFKEVLEELPLSTSLTIIHDGDQLMKLLEKKNSHLPHVLFLDLNMPRKNGFECLTEIKGNKELNHLSVIIFSTTSEQEIVNLLYRNGAQYYIRKPSEFAHAKKVIYEALTKIAEKNFEQPPKENFVLTGVL
jgi:CheY-like chemotaxis protein